jgi:Tol biopolymer transport system component
MAFQSGVLTGELWSLPADTNKGRVAGSPQRLTSEKAPHCCPSLTPDGNTLVFFAQRTDSMNIYLRDIRSGQEHVLVSHPEQEEPLISADGSRVVYTMFRGVHWPVYEVSTNGGPPRKVCDDCGPSMSLSSDGKQFLGERSEGSRRHINLVDVTSGQSSVLLQHSRYSLDSGRFSPDGKWVAFLMDRAVSFGGGSLDAVVAPLSGAKAVPEQNWITVTSRPTALTDVFWSPDGKLLYYVSRQAGRSSAGYLMAQRLDGRHQPTGAPIQVYQFTERFHPNSQLTAAPGRIVGAMNFVNYNIWMMDLPK